MPGPSSPAADESPQARRHSPWFDYAVAALIVASPLSKPATNIALGACALLFVREWVAGRLRPRATPLDRAIAAWLIVCGLSAVTSIDPLRSFRDLRSIGHWGVYYFVAWAVAGGASLARLENLWLAAGSVTAAQALLQGATGFDLLARGSAVPTGFFGGHLELGHYMVILLGLALARWADARAERERLLMLLIVLAFGAALVISGGRGPWLAFLAFVACWGVAQPSRHALLALALIVAVQAIFLVRQPQGLEAFYRSYVAFEQEEPSSPVAEAQVRSNRWRVEMWREGLRLFALRPVTGTGVETTGDLSPDFRTPFPDLAVAHLHSNYFEVLLTRGYFGLTAFFLLLIVASREIAAGLAVTAAGTSRAALFAALAGIVGHVVHGLTHFTIGSSWIQIGFYVALGLGIGQMLNSVGSRASREWRIEAGTVAWGLGTLGVAFITVPWLAAHPLAATLLSMAAAVDIGARWAIGSATALDAALAAAFAFVVVAAFVLLIPVPDTRDLAVRVMVAGAGPFAVAHLGQRLAVVLPRSQPRG